MRETVASIPVAIFRVPLNLPTSPLIERKLRGPALQAARFRRENRIVRCSRFVETCDYIAEIRRWDDEEILRSNAFFYSINHRKILIISIIPVLIYIYSGARSGKCSNIILIRPIMTILIST